MRVAAAEDPRSQAEYVYNTVVPRYSYGWSAWSAPSSSGSGARSTPAHSAGGRELVSAELLLAHVCEGARTRAEK